ncbi:MAG: hypothetical protein CMA37_00625 [Euryarchaeota archaeon]|nr:hypothetical protein [Euryarchaeota archaeon]|tara:strand:- start:517 stop:1131 length:615 start_codon:yes stop_codon:yes gene_type:complete
MIITGRKGIAKPGLLADAIGFTSNIVQTMNQKFGVDFSVSVEVGGDPNAMYLTGRFDSMSDYQDFRLSYLSDEEMSSAFSEGANYADVVEDRLGEILIPMGEPQAFAQVNSIQAISTNQPAAMEFFAQICGLFKEITGKDLGLGRMLTGDNSQVAFVGSHESLQEIYDLEAACLADERWLSLYSQSEGLIVPNSLVVGFRQRII